MQPRRRIRRPENESQRNYAGPLTVVFMVFLVLLFFTALGAIASLAIILPNQARIAPRPTISPSPSPTMVPTMSPTPAPTMAPTMSPSPAPTMSPTPAPTMNPTPSPTMAPTMSPTPAPTMAPTTTPAPTAAPTPAPTMMVQITCPDDKNSTLGQPIMYDEPVATGGCMPYNYTFEDSFDSVIPQAKTEPFNTRTIGLKQEECAATKHGVAQRVDSIGVAIQAERHTHSEQMMIRRMRRIKRHLPPERVQFNQEDVVLRNVQRESYPQSNLALGAMAEIAETGVTPPDPTLDVSPDWVVVGINSGVGGSLITIYDHDLSFHMSFTLESLAGSGDCSNMGQGDPTLFYDAQAGKWVLMQMTGAANDLCIFVSDGANPVTASWQLYQLMTGQFPDFGKITLFDNDTYAITTNEAMATVYFVERGPMLAGAMSTRWFTTTVQSLAGFGFQTLTCAHVDDGVPVPSMISLGGPVCFRHVDDEAHYMPPTGGEDYIEVFHFRNINYDSMMLMQVSYLITIPEFDSNLCSLMGANCITQPMGGGDLDALKEFIMDRAHYRYIASTDTHHLVLSWTTDVGSDQAGIFWAELRLNTGTNMWELYQSGIYAPDGDSRWCPTITIDDQGTIVIAYAVSSTSTFPSMRAAARLASDPLGMFRQEVELRAGASSALSGNRFGDYWGISTVPGQVRQFFTVGQYTPSGSNAWQVHTRRLTINGDVVLRNHTATDCAGAQASCIQQINLR